MRETEREKLKRILYETVLLPVGDLIFRQGLVKRISLLRRCQWETPERLAALQAVALQELLRVAFEKTSFYRRLFEEAGVTPEQVREVSDLRRLPIVTKEMIRSAESGSMEIDTGQATHLCSTSGSTGTNLTVLKDAATLGISRAAFILSAEWAGWRIGEAHLQMGMNLQRSLDRRLKDRFFGCRYMSAFELHDEKLDRAIEAIERTGLKHVWGYPGSLYALGRRALEQGRTLGLRTVLTWGDTLTATARRTLEMVGGCRVNDTYGCGEIGQVAAQCGHGHAYHVHMLDVVVEVLREDGTACGPGESGSLVLTRLHPGPMPMIRYAVGDVGVRADDDLCGCGRGLERLERVEGREGDVIVTPSGNRLIVHFFTGIIENYSQIKAFQVRQTRRDAIEVRVVRATNDGTLDASRLAQDLRQHGASDMDVSIVETDEIPLQKTGKRRFVIGLRGLQPGVNGTAPEAMLEDEGK